MKKCYYENLYLNALDTNNAVDVFSQSIRHVLSYMLLDCVIDSVRKEDVVRLLDILLRSKYDLERSGISKILYKYRFDREMYDRFSKLRLGKIEGTSPYTGIYNYCYFKRHNEDYSVDIINEGEYMFLELHEEEYAEYREVLKLICYYNRENKQLHEYVKRYLKDDLLVSILDENGCVNSKKHNVTDLMLVEHKQIYNADELTKTILGLCKLKTINACLIEKDCNGCRSHGVEEGDRISCKTYRCFFCGRRVADMNDNEGFKVSIDLLERRLEEWLFLEDIEMVEKVLSHCEQIQTGKILKVLLRIFLEARPDNSMNSMKSELRYYNRNSIRKCSKNTSYCISNCRNNCNRLSACRNCAYCNNYNERSKIASIAKLIGLFDANEENEYILVSFLKSCWNPYKLALLVPQIMKSRELYFACFAAMSKCGHGYVAEIKFRGIVWQFRQQFLSVVNDLIDYFCRDFFLGTKTNTDACDMKLMELVISKLARLFSVDPAEFISAHFATIYVALYAICRSDETLRGRLTPEFIRQFHYHVVTRRILDGRHEDQVNDPDVMVELFFQRKFDLDTYFKPNARDFIRVNLSQLLFKIKYIYNVRNGYKELNYKNPNSNGLEWLSEKCSLHNNRCNSCNSCNTNSNNRCNSCNTNSNNRCNSCNTNSNNINANSKTTTDKNSKTTTDKNSKTTTDRQCEPLIFCILRHIFTNITMPLYFNYVWPYAEYFVNKEQCPCASAFVAWLDTLHHSSLIAPYLRVPFKSPEDLPVSKGIENNLLPVLSIYFKNVSIGNEYIPIGKDMTEDNFITKQNERINNTEDNSITKQNERINMTEDNSITKQNERINNTEDNFITKQNERINNTEDNSITKQNERINNTEDNSIAKQNERINKNNTERNSIAVFIKELEFMESFTRHFSDSRPFRTKILEIYPKCPPSAIALLGHLGNDKSVSRVHKFYPDIPYAILVNFLLRTDPTRQDISAFLIQQFLPHISTPLDADVEAIVGQFRHTRLQYRCGCTKNKIVNDHYKITKANDSFETTCSITSNKPDKGHSKTTKYNTCSNQLDKDKPDKEHSKTMKSNNNTSSIITTITAVPSVLCPICQPVPEVVSLNTYRDFLSGLFSNMLAMLGGFNYMLHLLLLDNEVLGYATLRMLRVAVNADSFSLKNILDRVDDNTPAEILDFLLRLNPFIGKIIVPKQNVVEYALRLRDYYAVIYCLEMRNASPYDIELLRFCYYMVGDYTRVQGITATGKASASAGFFFELCIENNYLAAERCLMHVVKDVGGMAADLFREIIRKKRGEDVQISKLLESIMNYADISMDEFEQNPVYLHLLKDYQMLNDCKRLCNDDSTSSIDLIIRCVDVITARREFCPERETLLMTHRKLAAEIQIPYFTESVELDYLRHLRAKKDYVSCYECLALLLGHNSHEAMYEHALLKIDQRSLGEAKELLKTALGILPWDSGLYNRVVFTLCKISNSTLCYRESIRLIENPKEEDRIIETNKKGSDLESNEQGGDSELNKKGKKPEFVQIQNNTAELAQKSVKLKATRSRKFGIHEENNSVYKKSINPSDNHTDKQESLHRSFIKKKQAVFMKQKIYFYAAKHFEKGDPIFSLKSYFKAFNANYEAIPRFFHLLSEIPKKLFGAVEPLISDIVNEHLSNLLPFYSQLCNKICINHESSVFFQNIVVRLLEKHPHQTIWPTLHLFNSRKEVTREITVNLINQLSLANRVVFKNTQAIVIEFIKISQAKGDKISVKSFGISDLLPLSVTVPGKSAMIHGIKDHVHVFHSLQAPKKIVLVGSDGFDYPMIVKSKDDLRKDSRVIDLDILLNKLFCDSYYIRCYNVIPFTHDSGIIEYISNLRSLKDICLSYHYNINEVAHKFKLMRRIGMTNFPRILEYFPPIYNRYLKETFQEPFLYYISRENYVKTYAVMCVVGWFIGLGDRHAENIHFDTLTGDTVHVDLNCIFDKAKTMLEIPERVPFRLTQNILDGFGILATTGTFRHTMKYVLRVMKENKDVILANLLSFVFDPLFEWARKKNEPKRIIDMLASKLEFEDEDELIDQLVTEATTPQNLAAMYVGWMAFL